MRLDTRSLWVCMALGACTNETSVTPENEPPEADADRTPEADAADIAPEPDVADAALP